MKRLTHAFTYDPDLATIPKPQTMKTIMCAQTVIILSWKRLNSVLEYGDFICHKSEQIP